MSGSVHKYRWLKKRISMALKLRNIHSREFTKEEAVNENTFGLICTDAIVVIVNKASKLTNITAQALKDIYSGKIKNWSEVE